MRISKADLKKMPGLQGFSRPWSLDFSNFEILSLTRGWVNSMLADAGMEIT